MDEYIKRDKAIDALNEYFARIGKLKRRGLNKGEKAISLDTVGAIETLPSEDVQPVVYCKDCVWRDGSICRNNDTMPWSDDDFCSKAERRTDEA